MQAHGRSLLSVEILDFEHAVHARKSDMRMQQAENAYYKSGWKDSPCDTL